MLICLLLRHIMDDDLENPQVEGTRQNVRQLRRQPARSKRIVVRLLDEPRRAGRVNLDELVQKLLIDLRLAARQQYLKDIEVLVNIGDEARKADIGIVLLVCFLLLP